MLNKNIKYKLPAKDKKIKKILVIRLQATGDVVIMLPYIQDLKNKMPAHIQIDLLVREECENIPRNLKLFDSVFTLRGGRNSKKQLLFFFLLWFKLFFRRYDVLLDLQNHKLSAVMRFMLGIKACTIFDRTSNEYAGERYRNTVNVLGLADVKFSVLNCFPDQDKEILFRKFGLNPQEKYVVINPGGAFENRNLEKEKYDSFCKLWMERSGPDTKFIVLGIEKVKETALFLKEQLGEKLFDLVNLTTQMEAMNILRNVQLVISEDSGLLHMSYAVGTPTIGILGSTRNDWTNPNLPHTYFFNSSDMECGNCMLEKCRFSEIKCLARIKPEDILKASVELLEKIRK